MKKTIFALILILLVVTSCGTSRKPWYPGPVQHGGYCPANRGFVGYGQ